MHVFNFIAAANILGEIYIYEILTMALKETSEPLPFIDLSVGGIDESTRQTMDTHWPLFRESPTNTSLLFLSLSSNAVALKLAYILT